MIKKTRNMDSILKNNMGQSEKEVKADFSLPKQLWDMDRFTKYPSKLGELVDKQQVVNKIIDSIETEKKAYMRDLNSLTTKNRAKLSFHKSDLKKEKYIKESEFRDRKLEVEENKNKIIQKEVNRIKEEQENELQNFKDSYKNDLTEIYDCYNKINEILEKYNVKVNQKIEKYSGNWDEITIKDLKSAVNFIDSSISDVIENGITIGKAINKVKSFDKKQNTALGLGVLATTVLAAPVALITAGVTVGVTVGENKKVSQEVSEYCIKLIQLREIAKYMYKKRKENNTYDLTTTTEEINNIYRSIESQASSELEDIIKEEEEWKEDYDSRKNINFEEMQMKIYEDEQEKIKNNYKNKKESLNELRKKGEEQLNEIKLKMEKSNKIPPIKSYFNEEIFNDIQSVKKIKDDYLKFGIMNKLSFKKKEEFFEKYGDDISSELKAQIEYDEDLYTGQFSEIKDRIKHYKDIGITEEIAKENFKKLLAKETPLYILDTNKLHLGKLTKSNKYLSVEENEELFSEDWNNSSVIFVYKNEEEEKFLIDYIKYLVFQCMGAMSPQALEVNIINPTMDTKFNDILIDTTTMKDGKEIKNPLYSTNYSGEAMDELISKQKSLVVSRYNRELVGNKTLTDIVREKRELGSKVPKYILNILHRSSGSELISLNENSRIHGIINFVLVNKYSIGQDKLDKDSEESEYILNQEAKAMYKKDNVVIEVADIVNEDEVIFNIFQKNNTQYKQVKYKTLGIEKINDYNKFMEERYKRSLKLNSVTMIDEFISQLVGDQLWQGETLKNLKLYIGYVDGDKSKPYPVLIDEEAKVHMFMGGTTGGGKSVTLATIVNCLKAIYPPSELEIYYYDFKKVEVTSHIKPYKWANATAMSASATGDYLISLIDDIVNEMDQRYSDMDAVGVTKLSSYRKFMKNKKEEFIAEGNLEMAKKVRIPPRTLIIIDEVQQAFSISDNVTEKFKEQVEAIARLARAAGLHMLFVSQDPGNKIPSNVMDLFAIRACTKATPNVSSAVLRNNFAALPENQFLGFLGVNSSPTGSDDENIQYVVPLTLEPDSRLYGKITADMAESSTEDSGNRSRDAIIFSDNEKYSFEKLDKYLAENEIEDGEIVLGEIAKFQKVYEPAKIKLKMDQAQGISFVSADQEYKIDFFRTLIKSINKNNNETLVFFAGDEDLDYNIDDNIKNTFTKEYYIYDNKLDRIIFSFEEITEIVGEMNEFDEKIDKLKNDVNECERQLGILEYRQEDQIENPPKDGEVVDLTQDIDKKSKEFKALKNRYDKMKEEDPSIRFEMRNRPRKRFFNEQYGKKPTYTQARNGVADTSMVGIMKEIIKTNIEENKKSIREGEKVKTKYIIVVDPEKDPYVTQENDWKDKEFKQIVNEGMSYGIFFVTITSSFDKIASSDMNRYIIGINAGPEAKYNKDFKNSEPGFTQLSNIVNTTESFKFKMPTDNLVTLMPWER